MKPHARTVTDRIELFVDNKGSPKGSFDAPVPRSCIQSAEYIMQCHHHNKLFKWKEGEDTKPHIIAYFGKAVTIDATSELDLTKWAERLGDKLVDYNFRGSLPRIGRGLIVLRKKNYDTKDVYHLHCAAVVATFSDGSIKVSNMAEHPTRAVDMTALAVQLVSSVDDWRVQYPQSDYAVGLLALSTDEVM